MIPTQGYAAASAGARLAPFSFERRDPGAYDVRIDIQFCGICHSDIHQVREEWGGAIFPMVPGHEIAGIVSAVGDKVTKYKIGDRVGVGCFVDSCRECAQCRAGDEQYCVDGLVFTYNGREHGGAPTFGGYSNCIVVDEHYVLRIPDNLRLDASAPLLCAGITLYSPLMHWGAGPGKQVAIVGLGGLGHMGVKLGAAMGAEVTVLSHSLRKRDDAERMGAKHFHATSDPATFEKLKRRFDLIVNTVSASTDLNPLLETLNVDGTMVLVGVPDRPASVQAFALLAARRSLAGSCIGGIRETQEMLDFCGRHGIACDIESISIQNVNEAYERVVRSDVRYRFVIDLATLGK